MPRRNPISEARKSFLLPRLSPAEAAILPLLAEIDPTLWRVCSLVTQASKTI